MTFFQVMCGNLLSLSETALFFVCVSFQLLGEIPNKTRKQKYNIFSSLFLFVFWVSFLSTVLYKTGAFYWEPHIGRVMIEYIQIIGYMLVLRVMYRKPYGICMATAAFHNLLYLLAWNFQDFFAPNRIYDLGNPAERREYLFYEWIATPLAFILVVLLLNKTRAGKIYRQWESQKLRGGVLVFMAFSPIASRLLQGLIEKSERFQDYNPMSTMLFILILYLIFVYDGRREQQKKRIEEQNVSLRQQEVYIESLEGLQREVRRFRHDFKNMMSGMYMQAKEGDLEAIQSYIQEMTLDFDMQVGSQIRIMNQLANIRVAEVKGLFLEKIKVMQEEEIHCELEVLKPFEKTGLRSTDLCRCLGILLDNAMEEVRGKKDGKIHVMISSQSGCTTFRVKNTMHSSVDFHKIGTLGYSTKGENRGIGLANYKKILERYDRILPLTTIQDGFFIQELKVQES